MNIRYLFGPISIAIVANLKLYSAAAPMDQSPAEQVIASMKLFDLKEPEVLERIGMEPVDVVVIGSEPNQRRELRFRYPFGDLLVYIGQMGVSSCSWECAAEKERVEDLAKVWAGVSGALSEPPWRLVDHGAKIKGVVIDGTYEHSLTESLGIRRRWILSGSYSVEMTFLIPLTDAPYAKPEIFIFIGPDSAVSH